MAHGPKGLALTLALAIWTTAPNAIAEPESKCTAQKLKAASKKVKSEAKCHGKGIRGKPSAVADCLAKAGDKFAAAFAKAESKPPCLTIGDAGVIEAKVDGFVSTLAAEIDVGAVVGRCPSDKVVAAGAKASAKAKCYAKSTSKGKAVDADCLTKAETKFATAFAKAEAEGACPTTDDQERVEDEVDAFVMDLVLELVFPADGFPGHWVEQGPGPATVPGYYGYTRVSGAVEAIAADPVDPNRLFVGTVNGGIWKTNDATSTDPTWIPVSEHVPSLSIASLAFSPLDPTRDTLFASIAGTTHAFPVNGDGNGPLRGVLKTTDGGSTWTVLGSSVFDGHGVLRVLPSLLTTPSGQVVFAAMFAFPYDGPGGGIFRSDDGGTTWQKKSGSFGVPANGLPDYTYVDVVEDPGTPERFYTATDNPPRVFRSDDRGDSWMELTSAIGLPSNTYNPTRLAVSPTADGFGQHWIYVMAAAGPGIFVSADGGTTWRHLEQPPDGSHFAGEIAVSPTSPSIVFAASDSAAHWRGTVGPVTTTWYQVDFANAGGTAPHTDGRDWAFSADPNVMFEGDDGGIYRLTGPLSFSPSWSAAMGDIRVTEFLSIAYDRVNHVVFGACWDNSIPQQTIPNDLAWGINEDFYGDGVQAAADNTSMPGAAIHYSSQQNLFHARRRVYTSPTTVTSDTPLQLIINGTGGRHYNEVEGALGGFGTIRFNQSWTLNAADPTRFLFGTDYLYESFDRGDHFNSLGGIGTNGTGDPIPLNPVGTVTAYAYGHASNADVLYVGTTGNVGGHKLWVRASGTGYPTAMDAYPGSQPPWDIAIDPQDPARAYVADGAGRVWRTVNAGAVGSWTDVTGNLPELTMDLRTIDVAHASASGPVAIVVGGHGGVFVANDPDRHPSPRWRRLGDSFPNVTVTDLHYDGVADLFVVGTLGRGAWTLPAAGGVLYPQVDP